MTARGMNMQHYDNEPWVLRHQGNKPNDANHVDAILFNRELSDAANWRLSVEDEGDGMGTWEELQLSTADWLTEYPLVTAVVVVAVVLLVVAVSHLMPAPWGMP